jgi:hypothetical protein
MAGDLTANTDLASWPPFVRRVQAAMVRAAKAVGTEASEATPRSQLRRALSVNVFRDTDDYTRQFASAVADNPVIVHDSPDDAIEFTVNSVWDTIAGAPPPEG